MSYVLHTAKSPDSHLVLNETICWVFYQLAVMCLQFNLKSLEILTFFDKITFYMTKFSEKWQIGQFSDQQKNSKNMLSVGLSKETFK